MPNAPQSQAPAIEVFARREGSEYAVQAQNKRRAVSIYTGSVRPTADGQWQTPGKLPRHIADFLEVPFASLEDAIAWQVQQFGCRAGFYLSVFEEDDQVPGAAVEPRWIAQA